MHPLEPKTTMMYDVSRFQTLFVVDDANEDDDDADDDANGNENGPGEMDDFICHESLEMYDEELALEREEQEFEERNLGNIDYPQGLQSFNCRRCPESFLTKTELTDHRRLVHSRRRSSQNVKQKPKKPASELICETCGKRFQRPNALIDHINAHKDQRNFPCPECPARFVQRSNRDRHVKDIHHIKQYSHICPEAECGRRFQQRRELDHHVKTVHRKVRDLECDICKATFSHPVNFRKHLDSHNSIKSFGCHICKKLFGRQENRDIHLFVHSLCKAFVCSVCGADYMRRQQLIRHCEASGHVNEKIVRQKPQFSAAFARNRDNTEGKQANPSECQASLNQENLWEEELEEELL